MSQYKNLRCLTCLIFSVVGICFADKTASAYYGSSSYYDTDNPGIQYAVADLDLDDTRHATRETQYIRKNATQINNGAQRQGAIVKTNTSGSYDGECYDGEGCCEGEDKVVKNTIIVRMKKKQQPQQVQQVVAPQKKVVREEEENFKFNSSRGRVKAAPKSLNIPYVFGGYSGLMKPNLSLSNPASTAFCANCGYREATKSGAKWGHGFNIGLGFKHYFKDKPEGFFIAPEIFYHWLGGKATTYNGQTGISYMYQDMGTGTMTDSADIKTQNGLAGMKYKTKLKDLLGISLRLGGTKYGFSGYGKVNIGVVRVGHSFSMTDGDAINKIRTNMKSSTYGITHKYLNDVGKLLSGQSKTTFNLVGGIGAGIEYAFASDFFVRLQYDHYWTIIPLTKLKSNAFKTASGGNTWKPKMSFGILTLNVGIMW